MNPSSRVDVHVPGAEGGWIARALREAGLSVQELAPPVEVDGSAIHRVATPADPSPRLDDEAGATLDQPFDPSAFDAEKFEEETAENLPPALLVIDAHVEPALERLEPYPVPTIVVGWDDLPDEEVERLGLIAFFPRPVAIARLVRKVQTALGGRPIASSAPPRAPLQPTMVPAAAPGPANENADSERPEDDEVQDVGDAEEEVRDLTSIRPREDRGSGAPPPPRSSSSSNAPPDVDDEDDAVDDEGSQVLPSARPLTQITGVRKEEAPDEDEDAPEFLPREPTVALPPDGDTAPARPASVAPPPPAASSRPSSRPPRPASEPPRADVTTGASAHLSPSLVKLLHDADRRLFPDQAPLDLRLPGGDEDVDDLVPDDLLADASMPLELPEPDPLEAFTFVGSLDLLEAPGTGSSVSSVSEVSLHSEVPEHTPHTVADGLASRASRPPSRPSTVRSDLTREGMLPAGGVLRVLWQLHDEQRPAELQLALPGLGEVVFEVDETGRLVRVRGPLRTRVVLALRDEGRVRREPEDEASAKTLLDDLVRRGDLNAFERDERLDRALRELVYDAVLATESQFAIRSARGEGDEVVGAAVRPPLVALGCEGARRKLRPRRALRWLGIDADQTMTLGARFDERAALAGLEPALYAAFDRNSDRPIAELLGLPALVGAAGALFALASADVVRFGTQRGSADVSVSAVRDRIRGLHARCREGTYFEVLGVPAGASPRTIAAAHRRWTEELARLDLVGLGLTELEGVVQDCLLALDEALEILSDERWREAYRRALEG